AAGFFLLPALQPDPVDGFAGSLESVDSVAPGPDPGLARAFSALRGRGRAPVPAVFFRLEVQSLRVCDCSCRGLARENRNYPSLPASIRAPYPVPMRTACRSPSRPCPTRPHRDIPAHAERCRPPERMI